MGDESIEVVKIKGNSSNRIKIENPRDTNSLGWESTNVRVDVSISKEAKKRSAGSFIKREFSGFLGGDPKESVETYLKNYELLKNHGFPVPPTVRRLEGDPNALLITDLSENGTKKVFSWNEVTKHIIENPITEIENFDQVRSEMKALAIKADSLGIYLGGDAYFFVVDQNKQAKVVLGDLGKGTWYQPNLAGKVRSSQDDLERFLQVIDYRAAHSVK